MRVKNALISTALLRAGRGVAFVINFHCKRVSERVCGWVVNRRETLPLGRTQTIIIIIHGKHENVHVRTGEKDKFILKRQVKG